MQAINGEAGNFTTTDWSMVLSAGQNDLGRATVALERLCTRYWYPIYAFIRRRGSDHHGAEDLTQAFFTHLFEKETLKKVDRQKGKFRSFLLATATHFLTNDWDKRNTHKRGGQHQIISLDGMAAEERYAQEPVEAQTPEHLFERRWAFTLMNQALFRLKDEYSLAGKAELFARLEPGLTGEVGLGLYVDWAVGLKMTEGAVRVALHRLRRRFGELLRSEIAHTVATPEQVDEELRHLLAAIAG